MRTAPAEHRTKPARLKPRAAALLAVAALAALPCAPASAEVRKEAIDRFISQIGVTPSHQNYFLGKSITGYDYDFNKNSIRVGGKNGTGYYSEETTSTLSKSSRASSFTAAVRSAETGYSAGMRFGDYKKHAIRFGKSSKEVTLDPYIKTIYQGDCQPCELKLGQANISSESKFFAHTYDINKTWSFDTEYESEKNLLDTLAGKSIKTKIFTVGLGRKTTKSTFKASLASYKSSSLPGNKHIHLYYERTIKGKFSAFAETGIFSHGLPVASGPFSDLGDRFAFNYLGGESRDFNSLYSEKFGYYSIGFKATFYIK